MELHHLHLKGCTVSVPFWSFPGLHCVTVPCAASRSSPGLHCFTVLLRRFNDVISRVALSRSPVPHRRRRHLQGRTVQVPCAASPTSSSPGSHSLDPLCRIADVVISRVAFSRSPVPHRRRRHLQGRTVQVPCATYIAAVIPTTL
ncbi:hypothetical protein Zmor_014374 [Zophobas morio]|uniref:Uncharacterized protein n=1 Tax=Zophobas morio TaxID=2755281 RepID=A0AA38MGD5_9CUCU|nr:hypothetical protein Zmor_014374 [Zophobas morio]